MCREFCENSHVEPSVRYQHQSLDTLRELRSTGVPAPAGQNFGTNPITSLQLGETTTGRTTTSPSMMSLTQTPPP